MRSNRLTTQTLKHIYDRDNVIADFNEQNQMVAFYVTPHLDQPLSVTFYGYDTNGKRNREATYYYHYDGLGSVRALTDENGKIVADYDYTAFGESNDKLSSVLRRQQDAEKNRYTYTAREQSTLAEYGAPMNYRNRSYQPSLGRFTQRDPIGYGDGANVYGYVHNRPVNNVDPMGLVVKSITGIFGMEGSYPGYWTTNDEPLMSIFIRPPTTIVKCKCPRWPLELKIYSETSFDQRYGIMMYPDNHQARVPHYRKNESSQELRKRIYKIGESAYVNKWEEWYNEMKNSEITAQDARAYKDGKECNDSGSEMVNRIKISYENKKAQLGHRWNYNP